MSNTTFNLIICFICLCFSIKVQSLFRMSKVYCEATDPTYVKFHYCRLKAVSRHHTEFSFKMSILKKLFKAVSVRIELHRRFSSLVYRPFYLNTTVDTCDFLKNRKKYILPLIIYNLFKPFTNINHSCPFSGDIYMEKFFLARDALPFPLPNAAYLLKTDWIVDNDFRFKCHVWFVFEERNNTHES